MESDTERASNCEPILLQCRLVVISHKRHDQVGARRYAVQGGFPILKRHLARCVRSVRLCVPVYATDRDTKGVDYPSNLSVVPLSPYESRMAFVRRLPSIVRTLWREISRADLVYAMCPTDMGLLGLLLARISGKPFYITVDTDRASLARIRAGSTLLRRLRAWLVGTFVNSFIVALAGRRPAYFTGNLFLGSRPGWKQWVKTTVSLEDQLPLRLPRGEQLECLNVIFVGRLTPEKNVSCLIEAVAYLMEQGRPVNLTIAGSGEERGVLEAECAQRGLRSVRFLGHVENAELRASRFLGADVLVLPSLEERQGKVLLEAMACSVPVVAARVGGIPTIVSHGTTGLLFDPRSPLDLSRCIEAIATNPALRSRLVLKGYEYARKNTVDLSTARIIEEVAQFYGLPIHRASIANHESW